MTKTLPTISHDALAKVLGLLSNPIPQIAGHLLFDCFPHIADELVDHEWLTSYEIMESRTDDRHKQFVELIWHKENKQFRYFTEKDGWVNMPIHRATRYEVNTSQLLVWLRQQLSISSFYRTTTIVESACWYLGLAHIDHHRVHIYFARRLDDTVSQQTLLDALETEAGHVPALIMCPVPASDDFTLSVDRTLVLLKQLLSRTQGVCRLHQPSLSAIARSLCCKASVALTEANDSELRFSTDYRLVHWCGTNHRLTKKQAAVIEALYQSGGRAHKDYLCQAANTHEPLHRIFRNKVQQRYVLHPLWKTLINSEGKGYYSLSVFPNS